MTASAQLHLSSLPRAFIAAGLAGVCANALAVDGLDRARQQGKLVAGIHYVVPEYKGGMKFRTPEALDNALLEDVARRLQLPLNTIRTEPGKPASLLAPGKANVAITVVSDTRSQDTSVIVIPTGYTAGPMAIMRTDTSIKAWEQLKGRTVCVSEGGLYVGTLAMKYGAIEKVYKAPADALIAVRIGECDATVHDNAMLEELIKYPEWKKFSASLPVGPRAAQAFVVPSSDKKTAAFLKQVATEWTTTGYIDKLMKTAVRNIAFEVYLDQAVPDCH